MANTIEINNDTIKLMSEDKKLNIEIITPYPHENFLLENVFSKTDDYLKAVDKVIKHINDEFSYDVDTVRVNVSQNYNDYDFSKINNFLKDSLYGTSYKCIEHNIHDEDFEILVEDYKMSKSVETVKDNTSMKYMKYSNIRIECNSNYVVTGTFNKEHFENFRNIVNNTIGEDDIKQVRIYPDSNEDIMVDILSNTSDYIIKNEIDICKFGDMTNKHFIINSNIDFDNIMDVISHYSYEKFNNDKGFIDFTENFVKDIRDKGYLDEYNTYMFIKLSGKDMEFFDNFGKTVGELINISKKNNNLMNVKGSLDFENFTVEYNPDYKEITINDRGYEVILKENVDNDENIDLSLITNKAKDNGKMEKLFSDILNEIEEKSNYDCIIEWEYITKSNKDEITPEL